MPTDSCDCGGVIGKQGGTVSIIVFHGGLIRIVNCGYLAGQTSHSEEVRSHLLIDIRTAGIVISASCLEYTKRRKERQKE